MWSLHHHGVVILVSWKDINLQIEKKKSTVIQLPPIVMSKAAQSVGNNKIEIDLRIYNNTWWVHHFCNKELSTIEFCTLFKITWNDLFFSTKSPDFSLVQGINFLVTKPPSAFLPTREIVRSNFPLSFHNKWWAISQLKMEIPYIRLQTYLHKLQWQISI